MNKLLLAGATALVLAGSSAAYAQQRGWFDHHRDHKSWASAEDRSAFADARIAAVHAGLKLTPDQEKLWPPLEAAVKDFAKLRIDRAEARMKAREDDRKARDDDRDSKPADPVARLRDRADTMATTAAALKKIADAADPLYKSLDEAQQRRLRVLTRFEGGHGWGGEGRWHRHHARMHRDDDNGDRRGWERRRDHGSEFENEGGGAAVTQLSLLESRSWSSEQMSELQRRRCLSTRGRWAGAAAAHDVLRRPCPTRYRISTGEAGVGRAREGRGGRPTDERRPDLSGEMPPAAQSADVAAARLQRRAVYPPLRQLRAILQQNVGEAARNANLGFGELPSALSCCRAGDRWGGFAADSRGPTGRSWFCTCYDKCRNTAVTLLDIAGQLC